MAILGHLECYVLMNKGPFSRQNEERTKERKKERKKEK